jgi:alkylated DNA nucleotide flippase Atl1
VIPPQVQVRDGHVHHKVIGPMPGVVALENESVTSPSSLRQDDLFREIYNAARRVGYGMTITYGGLAKANGRTDWEAVALIIPRHRVLAVAGKIGGFSAPGGAETKEKMLALEGVRLEPKQTPFEILEGGPVEMLRTSGQCTRFSNKTGGAVCWPSTQGPC